MTQAKREGGIRQFEVSWAVQLDPDGWPRENSGVPQLCFENLDCGVIRGDGVLACLANPLVPASLDDQSDVWATPC